jgi:ribosomal protein S16
MRDNPNGRVIRSIGVYGPLFGQYNWNKLVHNNGIYLVVQTGAHWSYKITLVDLQKLMIRISAEQAWKMINCKKQISTTIYNAASMYWKKRNHREYQMVIAQWVQRELELPGEIAELISKFI